MIDPEIWQEIPNGQVRPAELLSEHKQDRGCDSQTKIRQEDQVLVLLLVKRALGVEVTDAEISVLPADALAFGLLMMMIMACHVRNQVPGPTDKLLTNEHDGGIQRSVFEQLMHLMHEVAHLSGVRLASPRHKHHISFHMASCFVVLAMANFPAEVWYQESRVEDPANGVVQSFAWRERLVSTLMCNDPETGTKQALNEGIDCPETSPEWVGGHIFRSAVCVEHVEDCC